MVTLQKYRGGTLWQSARQTVYNALRVASAIDIVPEKDEHSPRRLAAGAILFDNFKHLIQKIAAAVNVPHGIKPQALWSACIDALAIRDVQSLALPMRLHERPAGPRSHYGTVLPLFSPSYRSE